MEVSNLTLITLGVTAICLFIMLIFPYVLYARDMKDHLRTGKTFMESVTSTVILHLLLCFFFFFFFYVWSLANQSLSGNVWTKYSPQTATHVFLNVAKKDNNNPSSLLDYWSNVAKSLKNADVSGENDLQQKSKKYIKYSAGLIVILGLLYSVVLCFLPLSCILVPIFLSARYDKLNKNEGATMLTNKARYLVYGVAVYIIFGLHLKINDIFINGVLGYDTSNKVTFSGLHKEMVDMVSYAIKGTAQGNNNANE